MNLCYYTILESYFTKFHCMRVADEDIICSFVFVA